MDPSALQWIIPIAGVAAILFALYLARDVLSRDTGDRRPCRTSPTPSAKARTRSSGGSTRRSPSWRSCGAVIIGIVIALVETKDVADVPALAGLPIGLLTGIRVPRRRGLLDALGHHRHVHQRPLERPDRGRGARRSLVEAVQVAMRGGAVSGFLVVALSLLGVWGIFTVYETFVGDVTVAQAPFLIVGFGFGASFVALFAQLGGGIYTKAADVGSDLVGKVEAGIPEDDPRNAGVIADLVGDNVGDCAGRGADLFESTAAENIGAMILGVAVYAIALSAGWPQPAGVDLLPARRPRLRPLRHDRRDVLRPRPRGREPDEHPQPRLLGHHAPVRGRPRVRDLLDDEHGHARTPARTASRPGSGSSAAASSASPPASRSSTSRSTTRPAATDRSARSRRRSKTGPATNIISGTAVGFETTLVTAITIGIALIASATSSARRPTSTNAAGQDVGGIFGTAVATMGMLMTTAYILAMDTFGPITDNAGGIAEFSHAEAGAREITDRLDAVGNTTKALTKGYAIASASLAAFLLFSAYIDKVNLILIARSSRTGRVRC